MDKKKEFLDIKNNEHSYFIGLAQTDGNLYSQSRNRGKFSIEINIKDSDIVYKLKEIFKTDVNVYVSTRKRKTNFMESYESISLKIYDMNFRNELFKYVPEGKKSQIIEKPNGIVEVDYFRGIIDGDGSLGIIKNNRPFISLVTASEKLKDNYLEFIRINLGIVKRIERNARDKVYNIVIFDEEAQKLVKLLYYPNCLSIKRKYLKSIEVLSWKRPTERRKVTWERKKWTKFEDEYILQHTIEESINNLKRTKKSIMIRIWRLKNEKIR